MYTVEYEDKTKRTEFAKLKLVLIKLASTLSVAEIEYNTVKPYFHYLFLSKGYEPFEASMIASSITIIGYVAVVDMMAYLTRLFKHKNEKTSVKAFSFFLPLFFIQLYWLAA